MLTSVPEVKLDHGRLWTIDNNNAKSKPQTGREIRFLSISRKNRIFADNCLGKTFASPLEGYILAVSQPISNFQKAL